MAIVANGNVAAIGSDAVHVIIDDAARIAAGIRSGHVCTVVQLPAFTHRRRRQKRLPLIQILEIFISS